MDDFYVQFFLFYGYGDHQDLHVLTHAFPTRRSAYLLAAAAEDSGHTAAGGKQGHAEIVEILGVFRVERQRRTALRWEEHTSELQSLMRISYSVFCMKQQQPLNTK